MEIIAITVRPADQAFNALGKYRVYLEDLTEIPQASAANHRIIKGGK
jgi:hypothetical protein